MTQTQLSSHERLFLYLRVRVDAFEGDSKHEVVSFASDGHNARSPRLSSLLPLLTTGYHDRLPRGSGGRRRADDFGREASRITS